MRRRVRSSSPQPFAGCEQSIGIVSLLPSLATAEAVSRYHFQVINTVEECRVRFHAITAERRITHPGVALITGKLQADPRPASDSGLWR